MSMSSRTVGRMPRMTRRPSLMPICKLSMALLIEEVLSLRGCAPS